MLIQSNNVSMCSRQLCLLQTNSSFPSPLSDGLQGTFNLAQICQNSEQKFEIQLAVRLLSDKARCFSRSVNQRIIWKLYYDIL